MTLWFYAVIFLCFSFFIQNQTLFISRFKIRFSISDFHHVPNSIFSFGPHCKWGKTLLTSFLFIYLSSLFLWILVELQRNKKCFTFFIQSEVIYICILFISLYFKLRQSTYHIALGLYIKHGNTVALCCKHFLALYITEVLCGSWAVAFFVCVCVCVWLVKL